ncbi:MAG: transporter substrate-binding domain-containing protein [Candidatus Thermoplasmatota archaeon]|nr:transporter substrate-binding domain-containing protein [Candidatus Thermoplasmatota archaeon]
MENKKKILTLVLVLITITPVALISGCVEERGTKIIIGTNAYFPPFEFYQNNTIVGYDIELVTKILTDAGYEVEVRNMDFDSLETAITSNSIDIIAAGYTITANRSLVMDFSMPYFDSNQSVLINLNNHPDLIINSTDDFGALEKVGAQRYTTGEIWIQDNLIATGIINETQYEPYVLYTGAVSDLDFDRIQAVVIDKPVAQFFEGKNGKNISMTIVTNEQFGFAVQKGNTTLLNVLNTGLEQLMGSQYLADLQEKYFEQLWIIED